MKFMRDSLASDGHPGIMKVRQHRYGSHRSQVGDLYLPTGAGPFPVAIVVHGGFWMAAYDRHLMDPVCVDLTDRGWAAWNIEYRRVGWRAGGRWPATGNDVVAATGHLNELVSQGSPLDLGRTVVIGHSAGGHLALWLATRSPVPVRTVFSQAGVCDLASARRLGLGDGAVAKLLGRGPGDEIDARLADASPAAQLPLGVPQVLLHGDLDEHVPLELAQDYTVRAAAAGDEVELVVLRGTGHFDHIQPGSEAWAAVIERLPGIP
jgi:acetyl esterase/lipase